MTQDIAATGAPGPSKRIRAFDIIRGFFLLVILINHIELYPSFFDFFTGRGRMFVSAAEGFFFMSGLLVGLVYKRRLDRGFKFIFTKMWRRATELYIGSIFFTLLYTWLATVLNHPAIKDSIGDTTHWPHIIQQTILMRYGFGWADFLDRFAILMYIAPFAFYLIAKGRWWLMLALSIVAWSFRGNGFTLSWQILFLGAMLVGFYWDELQAKASSLKPRLKTNLKRGLAAFTLITFTISYASVFLLSKLNQNLLGDPWRVPHWLQAFTIHWNTFNQWFWLYDQKWTMGPFRIILFLCWFVYLFLLVRRNEDRVNKYTLGIVEKVGRNSLFVYIAHSVIVFGFKLFIPARTNIYQNFLITAAALVLLILVTLYYQDFMSRRAAQTGKTRRWLLKPTSPLALLKSR